MDIFCEIIYLFVYVTVITVKSRTNCKLLYLLSQSNFEKIVTSKIKKELLRQGSRHLLNYATNKTRNFLEYFDEEKYSFCCVFIHFRFPAEFFINNHKNLKAKDLVMKKVTKQKNVILRARMIP